MPAVTELYAYVMEDTGPDDEGVPAFLDLKTASWLPLMGADMERAEQLRSRAQVAAAAAGKPIKLIRSTGIEVVEVIHP